MASPADAALVRDAITALTNALTALPGTIAAALPPPAPATPAAVFFRSPFEARSTNNDLIDYKTKQGERAYLEATKSVLNKDNYFDVEPAGFKNMDDELARRALKLGLLKKDGHGNCSIPSNIADPTNAACTYVDIINDFGKKNLEEVREWERTFIARNVREAQDSAILVEILMQTLSAKGKDRITIWKDDYQYNDIAGHAGETYIGGVALWKVIVRESYLDSSATVSSIRNDLINLHEWIHENGTDIVELNAHVLSCMDGLRARGETTHDLLVCLFKAYRSCKDTRFLAYVEKLETAHDDDTAPQTASKLMNMTSNYYKKRLTSRSDPWDAPSRQETEIMAMSAQMDKLKALRNKQGHRVPAEGGKKGFQKGGSGKKVTPTKEDKRGKQPDWLANNTKPKDATKSKSWGDQEWWWCDSSSGGKCPGNWGTHLPKDCEGKRKSDKGSATDRKKRRIQKTIKAQQALLENMEGQETEEAGDDPSNSGSESE
jgi:hypothetical protein